MKNMIRVFTSLLILILFSCNGTRKKESAKDFYFPYMNFLKGQKYTYVNESDSTDLSSWKMNTEVNGKDTFLFTDIYNKNNEVTENLKEKIVANGSIMFAYRVFDKDSIGKLINYDCTIKQDSIFKWKFNPNDSCRWTVNYMEAGNKMEFSKARIFTGDSVSASVMGKELMCMEFYDRFNVKIVPPKGETKNYSYFIQSYYTKGLGLVQYKVSLPGQKRMDYLLKNIRSY